MPIESPNTHVLVVEDNVPDFVILARMLALVGIQHCEWKTSSWQLMQFVDTMPQIDLILMDIRLPHEDGYHALKKIRSDPRLSNVLVIAMTADISSEQVFKAKQAGFDGFLGKPLDLEQFPDQIRRILAGESVWAVL
ncbi:MAG: response regulator [Anaerolineae bacterium]|nr:response regulator [Anaerolineae bacterium]